MAEPESEQGGTLSMVSSGEASAASAAQASAAGTPAGAASIASTAEASSAGDASARGSRATEDVGPGDCVGRYTVRSLIGAGGMGQVFAAYDPELGRDVALKLIRPGNRRASRARARLLREARSLARLHHPNVVTVHDAGTQGDQIFVAMELVAGTTLTDWLARAPRSWREVLTSFLAAGRGLVAAHALGIVHRDFKPDNVIVGDERIVVVDFGLARAADGAGGDTDDADDPGDPPALEPSLTLTGERVGTPLYMAHEQHTGAPVTARADQFSFCVALWAALHGEHPALGAPPMPRRADVPGWVNAAVLRGLARDPQARWPTMSGLLAALSRDPRAARRRLVIGAAMVLLAAAATWGWAAQRTADPCTGAEARMAGVWDPARKDAVHAAFTATGLPFRDDAWRNVQARLDAYAARWIDVHREACRATRVEGRQSDTLLDLRMACLDRRRAVLGGITDLWVRGMDAETLEAASEAARGVPPLADCSDARALTDRAPLPADPARVAAIAAARADVDAAQALTLAHRWAQAKDLARAARARADATHWPQVRAEAALAEGDVLSNLSDPAAQTAFLEASRHAGAAHDDLLNARALTALVKSLAVDAQSAQRALITADIADGAIARAGDDPALRAMLLRSRAEAFLTDTRYDLARKAFEDALDASTRVFGPDDSATLWATTELVRVATLQGDYATARRLGEANLAATIRVLGPDHPSVGSTLNNLALSLQEAGDYDAAAAYLQRALAIKERVGGQNAAWTAMTLNNLGNVETFRGHIAAAEAYHERALAIRSKVLEPDNPLIAQSLGNLANIRRKQGRNDEALDLLRRALAIEVKAWGESHATVASHLSWTGDVLEDKGDLPGALDHYRRALEIRKKVLGPTHPETLHTMTLVGAELMMLHRCPEARPILDAAFAGLEKTAGADNMYVGEVLDQLARCDVADGRPADAVPRLERAIAIEEKLTGELVDRGSYRWLLARALWTLGRRDAAIAAARKAEPELASDPDGAEELAALRTWLAGRR